MMDDDESRSAAPQVKADLLKRVDMTQSKGEHDLLSTSMIGSVNEVQVHYSDTLGHSLPTELCYFTSNSLCYIG